jgi:hypothetical protein
MPKRARKSLKGEVELHFNRRRGPLKLSDFRERWLGAHGWKGLPTKLQREKLEAIEAKFVWLKGLFDRLEAGEQIKAVAVSEGISPRALANWWNGQTLPKAISERAIEHHVGQRLPGLRAAALRNAKIGYIFGAMLSGHLVVHTDKRGGVKIISSMKAGSVDHTLKAAQAEVFKRPLASKTRDVTKKDGGRAVAAESRAHSMHIATFLNQATFFGNRVPLEFLERSASRRQFAMALIDANAYPFEKPRPGGIRPEAGILFKTNNRDLRDYLSKLLSEFRVKHNPRPKTAPVLSKKDKWGAFKKGKLYQKDKKYQIFIPRTSFKKFRDEIGFRDPAKGKLLDKLISQG